MRRAHGFTLTEVLVALAVVALVLVALLGSMQAVVASATNIYDRTLAGWTKELSGPRYSRIFSSE